MICTIRAFGWNFSEEGSSLNCRDWAAKEQKIRIGSRRSLGFRLSMPMKSWEQTRLVLTRIQRKSHEWSFLVTYFNKDTVGFSLKEVAKSEIMSSDEQGKLLLHLTFDQYNFKNWVFWATKPYVFRYDHIRSVLPFPPFYSQQLSCIPSLHCPRPPFLPPTQNPKHTWSLKLLFF